MLKCSLLFVVLLASGVLGGPQRNQDSYNSAKVAVVYAVNPTSTTKSSNTVPVYPYQQPITKVILTPSPQVGSRQYQEVVTRTWSEDSRQTNKDENENKSGRPFIDWNFKPNERGTAGHDPAIQFKPTYPEPPSIERMPQSSQGSSFQSEVGSPQYASQGSQVNYQSEVKRPQYPSQGSQVNIQSEVSSPQYPSQGSQVNHQSEVRRPQYPSQGSHVKLQSEVNNPQYPPQGSQVNHQTEVKKPQYPPQGSQVSSSQYESKKPQFGPQGSSSFRPQVITPQFAPQSTPRIESDVSKGVAKLALSLDSVLPQKDNRLFSPASIGAALSLLLLGSSDKTGQEISNLLGVKDADTRERTEEIHRELGKIYGKLSNGDDFLGTQLMVACGLFPQKGITIKPKYVHLARSLYKSEVLPQDFRQREPEARANINQWVSSKTSGRIPNLLSQPIDRETSMVIVNALYFNGEWKYPFIAPATAMRDFHPSENEVIKVPMMVNAAEAYYLNDKARSLEVLGMPYKGDDVIMYILLPQENLQKFISTLTPDSIHEIINSTKLHPTIIYSVPKMKLESELKLRLPLEKLGVRSVFSPWASLKDIGPDVKVSEAYHKVEIEVTEAGTVGSAATSISLTRDGGTPMVRVDRPFVFFIYHAPSSSIIFWGSVLRPRPYST